MKVVSSPSCSLYDEYLETVAHLFCDCRVATDLWKNIQLWCEYCIKLPTLIETAAYLGDLSKTQILFLPTIGF